MPREFTECRGCGHRLVIGSGGGAYDPETMELAKYNFYGGWVCSRRCDTEVCLRVSSSMPGAGRATSLNSHEREQVERNWGSAT
jgi:hypothetical protein